MKPSWCCKTTWTIPILLLWQDEIAISDNKNLLHYIYWKKCSHGRQYFFSKLLCCLKSYLLTYVKLWKDTMFLLQSEVVSWIKFNLDFAGVFYWMLSLKILKGSRKIVQSLHWGAPSGIFDFPMIFQWKLDNSKKSFRILRIMEFF